jgi:hypothetical protein
MGREQNLESAKRAGAARPAGGAETALAITELDNLSRPGRCLSRIRVAGVTAAAIVVAGGSYAAVASQAAVSGAYQRPVAHAASESSNWSGYIASGSGFTSVKGTWVQPAVTCAASGTQEAWFWVGIDGYRSRTVEQIGSLARCRDGQAVYYVSYQLYPSPQVVVSSPTYRVNPGDKLSARVSASGDLFMLSIKSSAGWSFSATTSMPSAKRSSAEWIVSTPNTKSGLAKLADFGKVRFTDAEAATGATAMPIAAFTTDGGPHRITMGRSGTVLAHPDKLGPAGLTFSDVWKHS